MAIPAELLERIDRAIQQGVASSRNTFVANAPRRELAAQERAAIGAQFAAMADDAAYKEGVLTLTWEFTSPDAEAFRLAEPFR